MWLASLRADTTPRLVVSRGASRPVTKPTIPAIALLPLRIFFGITFIWAGLDKLLDPTFIDATAPTSLHAQLQDFARQSPLGDLIRASLPISTPIGIAIAVGELGAGIGTLTGLAFRLAATGGALLSGLFFLTSSWPTHPYYLGNDLPYLAGWIALAIAGHGNLLVPDRLRTGAAAAVRKAPPPQRADGFTRSRRIPSKGPARTASWAASPGAAAARRDPAGRADLPESPERRFLLQAGALAAVSAVVAVLTAPLRAIGIASEPLVTPAPTPTHGGAPTPTAAAAGPGPSAASAGDLRIASISSVEKAGSFAFTVPLDAPAPLPAGDPGIIVRLGNGSFVGYDAVCTHAGCTVDYDPSYAVIFCPCHGAEFDPAHDAAVIAGPTRQPLAKLPLVVDQASGTISLQG